jgi:predicted Zn-dependent peptidase
MAVQVTNLPNGLTVATESVPGALSVAAGVWVGVGARDEPVELSGASHFLEHLLFKGTDERSAKQISESVDRVGGDMNAFTTKEYTAYYCRMPKRAQAMAIELLGDVLSRPALRDGDVDSERKVILEELAMDDDSPDDVAHRQLLASLFPEHPLGRETAGDPDTVAAIRSTDIRQFHDFWYRTHNTVVAVAGDIDHDAVLTRIEAAFSGLGGDGVKPQRDRPTSAPGAVSLLEDDTEQVHLTIGFRAFDRVDPDREALDVMNHILGGGMSSRLFEEIREKRGLVYSVYSGASLYSDGGLLSVYAGARPEQAAQVAELIRIELDRLRTEGVTDDELDIARGYLSGSFALGLEDSGSRMARNAGLLTTMGAIRSPGDQAALWEAVTLGDVRRVIDRVLSEPCVVSAVGPITDELRAAVAG